MPYEHSWEPVKSRQRIAGPVGGAKNLPEHPWELVKRPAAHRYPRRRGRSCSRGSAARTALACRSTRCPMNTLGSL